MAKRVIWSPLAQQKRKEILKFWIQHNKSISYSIKLNTLFKEAAQLISHHPEIGKPTEIEHVRCKIVRDYLIFYEIVENRIHILTIWDNRQDPDSLIIK